MSREKKESLSLTQALKLIESVREQTLTVSQRQKVAIELAAYMLEAANKSQTFRERKKQAQLARMMHDSKGKAFTTCMTDQCFRSHHPKRAASQMVYLLNQFGIPRYLKFTKRLQLKGFQLFGKPLAPLLVPLATWALRKETASVILPGERKALSKHMQHRRHEGVRLNLNHLGEAILGEEEAKKRLSVYLHDLAQADTEYVSIKISTIFSQINLLAWDKTVNILAERIRALYRVAKSNQYTYTDGRKAQKFVNLDMEEYKDLKLTVEVFKKVLNEPEFHEFSAGIVLQAYLPDTHEIQRELTEWAMQRVKNKGAPIKIRLVKGANLAMEQVEASLRGWEQTPYTSKREVDANYKRMLTYGCMPQHAKAAHLGIASHNLFDIAYALLLRAEYGVEKEISFEMLEGMADSMRQIVQKLAKGMLLYCPVATKDEFQSAVAYLIRRLDENTGPDNFLRHTFGLKPHTSEWEAQARLFALSCEEMNTASMEPRRHQNRTIEVHPIASTGVFENEPDTDFALPHNRIWAEHAIKAWESKKIEPIPCVIAGKEFHQTAPEGEGFDPAHPGGPFYHYSLADWAEVEQALHCAKTHESIWAKTPTKERAALLLRAAQSLRESRGELLGAMLRDGGKSPSEADSEISEAIDFATYYSRSALKMEACQEVQWDPKGTILITPPWNFPVAIPAGGILAALVTGNCVLFKPAPEAVLCGWLLVNALWDAGISKQCLQFINCVDDPVGSRLIGDPRLNAVILTGATSTAHLFLKLRPGLDLSAETGGKNGMIITALSDRDLAIKDLIHSAFGHSGQKCSAASLAVCEAEVYDDPHFRKQLKDAVLSLSVGPAHDFSSKVVPLIHKPNPALLRALTTLEPGEKWLVKPTVHPDNPNLWSPGVKLGVKEGSFMHTTELFGPVLGLMRAKNLEHAIQLVNGTPYGLTSGLQSLDDREHRKWLDQIEAGNLYINRGITGAIVHRQPFGGCKASGYGLGAKAGGPNYLTQFATAKQLTLPQEKSPFDPLVNELTFNIAQLNLSDEEISCWDASVGNYAYWAKRFSQDYDATKLLGQDNFLRYRPYPDIALRIASTDSPLDVLRVCAAALSCGTSLQISWTQGQLQLSITESWAQLMPLFTFTQESEYEFLERVRSGAFKRVRLLTAPSSLLKEAAATSICHLDHAPVLASGRFELLHYLREIAVSIDYHRYGSLGAREGEPRKPVL